MSDESDTSYNYPDLSKVDTAMLEKELSNRSKAEKVKQDKAERERKARVKAAIKVILEEADYDDSMIIGSIEFAWSDANKPGHKVLWGAAVDPYVP